MPSWFGHNLRPAVMFFSHMIVNYRTVGKKARTQKPAALGTITSQSFTFYTTLRSRQQNSLLPQLKNLEAAPMEGRSYWLAPHGLCSPLCCTPRTTGPGMKSFTVGPGFLHQWSNPENVPHSCSQASLTEASQLRIPFQNDRSLCKVGETLAIIAMKILLLKYLVE